MAAANYSVEPVSLLSDSQHEQVATANKQAKKIRRAASVAGFNGWATGFFAVCSLPFAFFSLTGFLVTAGLGLVAYNEFRGRKRLLAFDQESPAFLGWNQVGFLLLIILYSCWMLYSGLAGESSFALEMQNNPELGMVFESSEQFDQAYRLLVVAIYGTVILVSTIFQGWNAIYYFTRRKLVAAYVRETPNWVLDLQKLSAAT